MILNIGQLFLFMTANTQGWQAVYGALATDLNTDGYFPQYASDITYEDQENEYGQPTPAAQSHETAETCALP
jgi:hypothetical protein